MKNLLKKSAVALAVAGSLSMAGVANADSLLAPFIATNGGPGGIDTYINFKIRGNANARAGLDDATFAADLTQVHYSWIQKGNSFDDLYNLATPCTIQDNYGQATSWDMIFQSVATGNLLPTSFGINPLDDLTTDRSRPATAPTTPFYGMLVIDDVANISTIKGNDGDSSGFAYVVDNTAGLVYDYKLLNNHNSTASGDFSAGFISKKVVDFAWGNIATWNTQWLIAVTSADMTNQGGTGSLGSSYDAAVLISQNTLAGNDSPRGPLGGQTGAYDHDERSVSGEQNVNVTCMGVVARRAGNFATQGTTVAGGLFANNAAAPVAPATAQPVSGILTPGQEQATRLGGWARRSITPVAGTSYAAQGAIIYKAEHSGPLGAVAANGTGDSYGLGVIGTTLNSFQIETSGHLAPGANHANRPN